MVSGIAAGGYRHARQLNHLIPLVEYLWTVRKCHSRVPPPSCRRETSSHIPYGSQALLPGQGSNAFCGTRAFSVDVKGEAGLHRTPLVSDLWRKRVASLQAFKEQVQLDSTRKKIADEELAETVRGFFPVALVDHVSHEMYRFQSHSKTSAGYNFSTNPMLREQYANPFGEIRFGRLLEDLDGLSAVVALTHAMSHTESIGDSNSNEKLIIPVVVTARIDSVSYDCKINVMDDAVLEGYVHWVGNSSMKVIVSLLQKGRYGMDPCVSASFVFVARHPDTGVALKVPRLRVDTESLLGQTKVSSCDKQHHKRLTPSKFHIMTDEKFIKWTTRMIEVARACMIMPVLSSSLTANDNEITRHVLMSDTLLESTVLAMPQDRNFFGRIFGGFLLRSAYEIAFNCVYIFAGTKPDIVDIEDVSFNKPVSIGDLVQFRAKIVRTEGTKCFVEVITKVISPKKVQVVLSNEFYFTFDTNANSPLPEVLPSNYDEAVSAWRSASRYRRTKSFN